VHVPIDAEPKVGVMADVARAKFYDLEGIYKERNNFAFDHFEVL
jgi:hypothetical protein